MFYKVIKNNRVLDVLDEVIYLKYQKKYDRMLFCSKEEAQGIFSSDRTQVWHVEGYYGIPAPGYETVQLVEIEKSEYEQLKTLCGKTPEEIIDNFVLSLAIQDYGVLKQSLNRLKDDKRITSSFLDIFNLTLDDIA